MSSKRVGEMSCSNSANTSSNNINNSNSVDHREGRLDKIASIVREVEKLSDPEKLLLYLQLPYGRADLPEGKANSSNRHNQQANHHQNHQQAAKSSNGDNLFGCVAKKLDQETTQTYTWILSHLEEDPNISLPKQEVYDEYRAFCQANCFEPLCVADFGKAMKHALPCIKPRRLGQRGNSRYCYSGLRKKYRIEPPSVADINDLSSKSHAASPQQDQQMHSQKSSSSPAGAQHPSNQRQLHPRAPAGKSPGAYNRPTSLPGHPQHPHQQQLMTHSNRSPVMNLKLEQQPCKDCPPLISVASKQQVAAPCCSQATTSGSCQMLQSPTANPVTRQMGPFSPHINQRVQPHVIDYTPHHPAQLHHQQQQQQQSPHQIQPPQTSTSTCHVISQPATSSAPSTGYTTTSNHHAPCHQQTYLPRPGTPDDDDYRHNYHDLNRPIVGSAIIPFSQSLPVQLAKQPAAHESFISYNNTSYPPHPHQLATNRQQHHHPQDPNQQHHPNQHQHHQQQQQQQPMMQAPSCCSIETMTTKTLSTASATENNNSESMIDNRHQGCQQQVRGSGSSSNNNDSEHNGQQQEGNHQLGHHQHHQFEQTGQPTTPNQTLAHLNLNLHLGEAQGAEMDFASPFQSPASTPFPSMMNTNSTSYLTQDTQDYYSASANSCNIQYPDH